VFAIVVTFMLHIKMGVSDSQYPRPLGVKISDVGCLCPWGVKSSAITVVTLVLQCKIKVTNWGVYAPWG